MRDMTGFIYRYEMHVHNNLCSKCAHNSPEEMVEAYAAKGYTGLVFTDHFLLGNTAVDQSLPWADKMACYYGAYLQGRDYAEKNHPGFHVLFGLEHQYGHGKEVLTYGIDLDFLLAHPNLHLYSLEDYTDAVRKAGGLISMAHPYRKAPYIDPDVQPRPELLDGAEIFNFCNTEEDNQEAAVLAREYGLIPTSGGDVHQRDEPAVGMAGIALSAPIDTGKELVAALRSGDYRLIINGSLV